MTNNEGPFFHLDLYSSLPVPEPVPVPPHSLFLSIKNKGLCNFAGKILGRMKLSVPLDAPISGIGVAPGWLTDTRPGQVLWLDRGPFWKAKKERRSWG